MSDYIDRQAAIAHAISGRIRTLPTSEEGENWIRTEEVRQSLLDIPPAEVEPVKHGRWKPFDLTWGRSVYACTSCGEAFEVPTEMGKPIFIYCPYCGARMETEEQKETRTMR